MRPRSSITAATCTSLWVSTPPRTLRATPDCAMVAMPLLPHQGPRVGTHRRAGGQDSDRALAQVPLRSRSPNRCVRCAGPRSPGRLITSKAPNRGRPICGSDRASETLNVPYQREEHAARIITADLYRLVGGPGRYSVFTFCPRPLGADRPPTPRGARYGRVVPLVEVNSVRLLVEEAGNGEPLVLV